MALLRGRHHQDDAARPLASEDDQRQRSDRTSAIAVAPLGGLLSEGKLIHAGIICNFCIATIMVLFACVILSRWVALHLYTTPTGGVLADGRLGWLNQSLENTPLPYQTSPWREGSEERPGFSSPEGLRSSQPEQVEQEEMQEQEQAEQEQKQKQTQEEEEQEQGVQERDPGETPAKEAEAGSDGRTAEDGSVPRPRKKGRGRRRGRGRGAGSMQKEGKGSPLVAFLFLTRGPLPLRPLWELFFNSSQGKASVYVHASIPGYNVNRDVDRGSFFWDRQVEQVKVQWGGFGMVAAEKKLLEAALKEERNQRFVLLSEACIPLRPLDYVSSYLLEEGRSFLASYSSTWRLGGLAIERYIPRKKLMKGSQWFALTRAHAEMAVKEYKYQRVFQEAKARIPDETYMQTVLPFLDPQGFIPRPVTFVQWHGYHLRRGKTKTTGGALGPGDFAGRPRTFYVEDVSRESLAALRDRTRTSEERVSMKRFSPSLPCTRGGTGEPLPCFLFARKFHNESLAKLLEMRDLFGY